MSEGKNLKQLGSENTEYKLNAPDKSILETFENKYPEKLYNVEFIFPEFTSLCPKTGQPDFATITINYNPDEKCIESKSLKLYFFTYRNYGSFMETIVNKILGDIVWACSPIYANVKGCFNARGGTSINVTAYYKKEELLK